MVVFSWLRAESATTTASVNGSVRARSVTVRAAVVSGRLYSLVTCSLGSSLAWKTTSAGCARFHFLAAGA